MTLVQHMSPADLSRQWASRPDDERYLSLDALAAALVERRERSFEKLVKAHEFMVRAEVGAGGIAVETPHGDMYPTHWSFGQLVEESRLRKPGGGHVAPRAAHLRAAHPRLTAEVLNYGYAMRASEERSAQLMILGQRNGDDDSIPSLRALTSADYGRIWDAQVAETFRDVAAESGSWVVPALFSGSSSAVPYDSLSLDEQKRATTLYAGDRDVWMFLCCEDAPIEIDNPGGRPSRMLRGVACWNSEVRASRFGILYFLYDLICANRTVWGARDVEELTIVHSKGGPERFRTTGVAMLRDLMGRSAREEEERIRRATRIKLGNTPEAVIERLQGLGWSRPLAQKSVESAIIDQGKAETVWDVVSGGTAAARVIPFASERIEVERRVSSLLDLTEKAA